MKQFVMEHPVMSTLLGLAAVGTVGTIIVSLVAAAKPAPAAATPPATTPPATTSTPAATSTPPASTSSPAGPPTQFVTGSKYELVAPMPTTSGGVPYDVHGIQLVQAFQAAGWSNIVINATTLPSSTQPTGTYDVTATRTGATIDVPPGVTATLVT